MRGGKSRPVDSTAAGGALTYSRSIRKQCVDMAPRSWELIGLSLLAGLGLGLALDRGDLIFVAVFGAVGGMAIIVFREPIVSGVRDPRLA